MNTSLVSLLAAASITALLALTVTAQEPGTTTAPVPTSGAQVTQQPAAPGGALVSPTNAAVSVPGASPSATPVHHHHHPSPTPSPSPSPTPKKHWFWQKKAAPKPSPGASPAAKAEVKSTPAPTPLIPRATPTPAPTPHIQHATPTPSPSPKPRRKSGSFWSLFKHRARKPPATPTPSPTPHRHHAIPEATASPSPAAAENAPSVNTAPPPPAPEATPTPAEKPGSMTSTVPFVPPPAEKPMAPLVETKTPQEEEAEVSAHFQAAKAKALQDQHIEDLQNAADSATGDDAKPAMRKYYKALYDKMRDIDPSITDRIDRTEAASLRRVEEQTPQ